ncbi:MAG: aminotransferase class V-fold PLP-dependent enzyme [Spiroplasma sp.]|nr:aminotransferase class V-fold PLP-dependent enzyme [Mycoplasmatales bacterium]
MKYFNYAATTKTDPKIEAVFNDINKKYFMHPDGDDNSQSLRLEAKNLILKHLGVEKYNLIFTSGGTEANNLAIFGNVKDISLAKEYITSSIEHPSVYDSFKFLEKSGHIVHFIDPRSDGKIYPLDVVEKVNKNTTLVSIMSINNETGVANDVMEIARQVKEKNPLVLMMIDHVQGLGKIIDFDLNYFDFISLSAHKLYGYKGSGCLIMAPTTNLQKILHGGLAEDGFRGGTQNVALQVCLAKAISQVVTDENYINDVSAKIEYLIEKVNHIAKIKINVATNSNILSIRFNTKMMSETILKILSDNDIYASSRSACSTKLNKGSRVLEKLKLTPEQMARTIRVSVGTPTTYEEIDFLIDTINKKILKE